MTFAIRFLLRFVVLLTLNFVTILNNWGGTGRSYPDGHAVSDFLHHLSPPIANEVTDTIETGWLFPFFTSFHRLSCHPL